jgi:3-hydroxyisobutyrate dehydrogenase
MAAQTIGPPSRITVIGLGNMGLPMSACLVRAGFDVIGFDISPEARERFAVAGLKAAGDIATAVGETAAVITLLPNGGIVRAAIESLRLHLRPGTVLIDMSSSEPLGTRALGEAMIAAGFPFIDAPVSGGVKRAVDGTLAIMTGGDGATIDRVEPVLAAMGRQVFRTGPLGSGHAVKALNNYVSAAGLVAAVEALAASTRFGVDPLVFTDVLNASSGRNNTTEIKMKPFIIPESYTSGFSLGLMAKDIRTADDLGRALGLPMPLADVVARLWTAAEGEIGGAIDHTAIGTYIAGLDGK